MRSWIRFGSGCRVRRYLRARLGTGRSVFSEPECKMFPRHASEELNRTWTPRSSGPTCCRRLRACRPVAGLAGLGEQRLVILSARLANGPRLAGVRSRTQKSVPSCRPMRGIRRDRHPVRPVPDDVGLSSPAICSPAPHRRATAARGRESADFYAQRGAAGCDSRRPAAPPQRITLAAGEQRDLSMRRPRCRKSGDGKRRSSRCGGRTGHQQSRLY